MSMSLDTQDSGLVATINVTPLVDVMLVMLVIFMVTAPMLQQGVDVNLPKVTSGPMQGSDEQVVISIDQDGKVYLGSKNEVAVDQLADRIKAIMEAKKSQGDKVYIKADSAIDYGKVMGVMGALYSGGITQIGLVSAPPEEIKAKNTKKK